MFREMGLKGSVCVALFLSLNLLSLSMVTSQTCPDLEECALKVVHDVVGFPNPAEPCCEILVGIGAGQAGRCLCEELRSVLPDITSDDPIITVGLNRTLALCGLPDFGQCP